ncbi:MAG: hypothetical protein ACJ79N_13895, partial [Gemmatimonadaceae bacterium]
MERRFASHQRSIEPSAGWGASAEGQLIKAYNRTAFSRGWNVRERTFCAVNELIQVDVRGGQICDS